MKRITHGLLVQLCVLCLLPALTEQASQAQQKLKLHVGYLPVLAQLPLVISYENDRKDLAKSRLELYKYTSFTALEAALRVGAIDVASLPIPIVLSIAADGRKIRIIGAMHHGGSRMVTKAKIGIEGLREKLIGVPGLDTNENFRLSSILAQAGLREGMDYRTIRVSFTTVVEDFKREKLDALYLPEPFGAIIEHNKLGFALDVLNDKLAADSNTVLVVRSEVRDKSLDAVEEWLNSVAKSCEFLEKDVKESGARQTAILQARYFGFPEDIVTEALVQRKGNLQFGLFAADLEEIKKIMNQASQIKMLTKSVNPAALLTQDEAGQAKGGKK